MKKKLFFIVAFLLLVGVWDAILVYYVAIEWTEGILCSIIMTCGTIAVFDVVRQKLRS